jgi:hypothetical protein
MYSAEKVIALALVVGAAPRGLEAQFSFETAGRPVQIHSFGSQGFAYSNHNNYLTMKTSRGSFAMTDIGVNASVELADKLHVGAQVYDRDFGNLGRWHPELDWLVVDYRFKDWLGFRAGAVKTVFGLSNDSQDVDALHTFALLPQSVYPTDLRDATLNHWGGDLYGEIPLRHAGDLSYTIYGGQRRDGRNGGYPYLESPFGIRFDRFGGPQFGQDLRWKTPVRGLLVGASHLGTGLRGRGTWTSAPPGQPSVTVPYEEHSKRNWANQFYGEYTAGKWRLAAEYRRSWFDQIFLNELAELTTDVRSWYASAEYQLSRRVVVATYYSRWTVAWLTTLPGTAQPSSSDSPNRHLYDKVVAARVNLTPYWYFKVEGHFMDGYGCINVYPSGFYAQDNPQGLRPKTNLLLIRTGWSF